eukprot:3512326-Rhodomonas_salina.1
MPPKRTRTEADHDPVQRAGRGQRGSPGQGRGSISKNSADSAAPCKVRRSARTQVSGGRSGRGGSGKGESGAGGEVKGEAVCRSGVSTGTRAPEDEGRRCILLSLPSALLGRFWPTKRVVIGLR